MLSILCVNCYQKNLISEDDKQVLCPHCQASFFVNTGIARNVQSEIKEDSSIDYELIINNTKYNIHSKKHLRLKSKTVITVIMVYNTVVAITDHSRDLWIGLPQQRRVSNIFKALVLIAAGGITSVWIYMFIKSIKSYPLVIVFALLIVLITSLLAWLAIRSNNRDTASSLSDEIRIKLTE